MDEPVVSEHHGAETTVIASPPVAPEQWDAGHEPGNGRGPARGVALLLVAAIALMFAGVLAWQLTGGEATDSDTVAATAADPRPSAEEAGATDTEEVEGVGGGDAEGSVPKEVLSGPTRSLVSQALVTAPKMAPPSEDSQGNTVTYLSDNMLDGEPDTAWRMEGDGSGGVVWLNFERPVRIDRVGIINGYAKVDPFDGTDRYKQNRRITGVTWIFSDGSEVRQRLDRSPEMQYADVAGVMTRTVRLRIDSVSAVPRAGKDYTAISEVTLSGSAS
jgi:hypothetical protein